MDISFQTSAGEGSWSLEECAKWAQENDFDCIRLADNGVLNSDYILETGPEEVNTILAAHDLYLACISSHCNLLDDDENIRQDLLERLPETKQ